VEIAKQIRLRDLSGIIAIDFIDMHNLNHIYQVEEALRNALSGDHAALRISSINEFGVLFLSRQRSGFNIYEILYKKCAHCIGYGFLRTVHSLAFEILSEIRLSLHSHPNTKHINVECAANIVEFMLNDLRGVLYNLEKNDQKITITINDNIPNSFKITPPGEYIVPIPVMHQPAQQQNIILKVRYLEPDLPLYRHYISLDHGQCLVDFNHII
jgi:ribonuclease E